MVINMGIAFAADTQIDQGVARQLIEHVIKKANTCLIVIKTSAIQIQRDFYFCFSRVAAHGCVAHEIPSFSLHHLIERS